MAEPAKPAPSPRQRRNALETKAKIVATAQRLFASAGFAQTRLRDIADGAGVAVSLLPQHFGSKADLFEEALCEAMKASHAMDAPTRELGRVMIDYLAGSGDITIPAMIIRSIGDPVAHEITTRLLRGWIIPSLAQRLGPPHAQERAIEIAMLATGFLIYVRQISAGEVSERTKTNFAQMLQTIMDEECNIAPLL